MADYNLLNDPAVARQISEEARQQVDDGGNTGDKNVSSWVQTAPAMTQEDRVTLATSLFKASSHD